MLQFPRSELSCEESRECIAGAGRARARVEGHPCPLRHDCVMGSPVTDGHANSFTSAPSNSRPFFWG